MGSSWNVTGGTPAPPDKERGRSGRSRLGNFFKPSGSSSQVAEPEVPPRPVPERAKLRKRSTSGHGNARHGKLNVVGE